MFVNLQENKASICCIQPKVSTTRGRRARSSSFSNNPSLTNLIPRCHGTASHQSGLPLPGGWNPLTLRRTGGVFLIRFLNHDHTFHFISFQTSFPYECCRSFGPNMHTCVVCAHPSIAAAAWTVLCDGYRAARPRRTDR